MEVTEELKSEVNEMCNLSEGIYENGINVGIEQGIEQGIGIGIEKNKLENVDALLDVLDDQTISEKLKVDLAVVQERRRLTVH